MKYKKFKQMAHQLENEAELEEEIDETGEKREFNEEEDEE